MTLDQRERILPSLVLAVFAVLMLVRTGPGAVRFDHESNDELTFAEKLVLLDLPFWDHAQRSLLGPPPPTDEIVVVLVDDESLARLGERWPMSRLQWARFLETIEPWGPAAVGLDAWFESPAPSGAVDLAEEVQERLGFGDLAESMSAQMLRRWLDAVAIERDPDRRFQQAIAGVGRVFTAVVCPERAGDTLGVGRGLSGARPLDLPVGEVASNCAQPVGSVPSLALATAGEASIQTLFDPDRKVRRYPFALATPQGAIPSLATSLALLLHPERSAAVLGRVAAWAKDPPLLRYQEHSRFTELRFSDVVEFGPDSPAIAEAFAGKVVLVGVSARGAEDRRNTAIENDVPGVYVHANAVADLLSGTVLTDVPRERRRVGWLAVLGLFVVGLTGLRLKSATGVSVALGAGVLVWMVYALGDVRAGHATPIAVVPLGLLAWAATRYAFQIMRAAEARKQAAGLREAFGFYLSPQVVEDLVAHPDKLKLGGERREITAFFSDVAGFTTISESLEPARLSELLNEVLGGMTDIIVQEGGTIDKYIGDAIVAMFGAPLDQPDHVDRALRAAQRCQAWLAERRPQLLERGFPEVVVRIGLNSGEAIVGNMGSEQRFDYSMLGDTVNLAARLEGACKFCGVDILIGPKTAAATRGTLVREVDKLQVKGKTEGVSVWSPVSLAADLTADEEAFLEEWELALRAYRSQDWDGAQERLTRMADAGDGPAATLLGRIPGLRESDLPPEWDGVYHLTSK